MFDSIAMFEAPWQWAIVLVIVLVLFGGSRIKDVMGSLGSGVKEFKKGLSEDEEDKTASTSGTPPTPAAAKKE
jgi:sec-independent protein translocase protein TatA